MRFFQKHIFVLTRFSLTLTNNLFVFKLWHNQKTDINIVVLSIHLKKNMWLLKNIITYNFNQLSEIAAHDIPQNKLRFSINYILFSLNNAVKLNVIVKTNETDFLPTVSKIYSSANWSEREIWDLFGIYFNNHNNLERILTDYGFNAHALRKSYPLSGFEEIKYSISQQNIINTNIYSDKKYIV